MATFDGKHLQRSTQRELGYWAAYGVHGNMLMYSATVTDGDIFSNHPTVFSASTPGKARQKKWPGRTCCATSIPRASARARRPAPSS